MSKYLGIAYNLRLPPELKEKVQESAKALNRSMNADIVARLEQSFDNRKADKSDLTTEELMEELSKRFDGVQVTITNINK
ncbi:Arc family DNA-binding protein [Acinetobacter gerneri]|uniref:Arc family DNA-binding protein n=1 Tax=Acinetobacter gerneri TaxID=202952 RepID=UPI0028B08126|nr:Arc family DNA-binding protein [Acinetobacter gerneri]MDV2441390.1 Arc family DNA-binding protein [Acinetobacter gerneri]